MAERLTQSEAFERARSHDQRAQSLRAKAATLMMNARRHERWAAKWRDWADDEYDEVPYPGEEP